jgi:DNA repair ATPase RecN
MKLPTSIALAAILLASGLTAQAACVYPQAPQAIPNGSQATKDQMVTANGQVKEYVKAVESTYLPCLDEEMKASVAALDPADPEYAAKKLSIESMHAKKYNAAVDEEAAVADRMNQEIKAFKAKGDKQ